MNASPLRHSQRLVDAICCAVPMQRASLRAAASLLTEAEREELDRYIARCRDNGIADAQLVESYKTINEDTLREQIYFRRNGVYRYSTFDEVASSVYFHDEYMRKYMYGLALTLYLWPNHLEILRYFDRFLTRASGKDYLEIGPGHGAFFSRAIRSRRFSKHIAVDISPTSLALTRSLLEAEGLEGWELQESDFLAFEGSGKGFDAIVMGEVLEHVEKPGLFLDQISHLAAPGAFIFVTTAVNAPAVDHIHLFRSVQEVVDLAMASQLDVVDVLAPPYHGCSMEQTIEQRFPINVAMVLTRK